MRDHTRFKRFKGHKATRCNKCARNWMLVFIKPAIKDILGPTREIWWHPTPVLLPGKSHGRRSLVGSVHGVAEGWTRLSDFTFTFHFHALEKEMATHSSVLAWRIPGTGKPGGPLSMGSQRVGHDWSDLAAAHILLMLIKAFSNMWKLETGYVPMKV